MFLVFIHSEYKTESLNKATFRTYDAKDALPEMFPKVRGSCEELNGYTNGFHVIVYCFVWLLYIIGY